MLETSGSWVTWLPVAAGVYLLFEIWRGWRRGVVRHGVSLFALLSAGGIGWVFAWMTGWFADRVIPLPLPGGRLVFGLAAGLAFYVAVVTLSSLLFKKTSQQSSGLVRLIYGAGGAVFGLIFGLTILWGGVSILRALGAVAQGKEAAAVQAGVGSRLADQKLAGLKDTLGQGAAGRVLDKVDVVPPNIYSLITKLVQVSRSPEASMRFFEYHDTQRLLMQPKIAALLTDPSVAGSAAEGNYLALLTNPKLSEVVSDPEVQKSFTSFELEKALDYALQSPPISPVP